MKHKYCGILYHVLEIIMIWYNIVAYHIPKCQDHRPLGGVLDSVGTL